MMPLELCGSRPVNPETDTTRLAYVDNLRIFLTMLVICEHVAIGLGAPGSWYYIVRKDPGLATTLLFTLFVAVNQAFFMSLFFAVSAYFVPGSLDRKGPRRFLSERFARLGIPLVVFFFGVNPVIVHLVCALKRHPAPSEYVHTWGPGPLWFVFALMVFSTAYVVIRMVCGSDFKPRAIPSNVAILCFSIVIGLAAFVVRLQVPVGSTVLGVQLGFFPLYICMFVFGIRASRNSWLKELSRAQANRWYSVAVVFVCLLPFIVLGMKLTGALDEGFSVVYGGAHWQALVYAMWEPFVCVGISMKLIVLFRDRLNGTNAAIRAMAASAYTVYIIHPFFVILATWLIAGLPLPILVMFGVVSLLSVSSCFLAANVIRKLPLLRRIL